MVEQSTINRRRQRRRAIIAWSTAAIVVALFALGAILGGEERHGGASSHGSFGFTMTSEQYDALRKGITESGVEDQLDGTGVPEYLLFRRYADLFPAPPGDSLCTFWEISDSLEQLVRICFSNPGERLVQKLQRRASGEEFGVRS